MKKVSMSIVMLVGVLSLSSCTTSESIDEGLTARIVSVSDDGTTIVNVDLLKSIYSTGSADELSDPLAQWIKYMREEEKLARIFTWNLAKHINYPFSRIYQKPSRITWMPF